jgi:isorenieratene synthase
LRSPTFRAIDLVRINARAAAPLAAVSVPDIYRRLDDVDAETFLENINFPSAARHLAFEVFSRSFFSEPSRLSAAELATMFHIYFLGSSEGLVFDVATANFDSSLWEPLRGYLTARGVQFHAGSTVRNIDCTGPQSFRIQPSSGAPLEADGVVLAADVNGLAKIIEASPELGDEEWRARIADLHTAPPFLVLRLWLDRPVHSDRPAFLGTGGLKPLDNISVLERYEGQAAEWARAQGGSVVELHAYAVEDTSSHYDTRARLLGRLHDLYPETASAKVVGEKILYREDCPRFAPGDHVRRPGVATPVPALALAGDGIRIDLPVALMERAATTGFAAANQLLSHWGIRGHTLHTVPIRGRSALLRRLASRERMARI